MTIIYEKSDIGPGLIFIKPPRVAGGAVNNFFMNIAGKRFPTAPHPAMDWRPSPARNRKYSRGVLHHDQVEASHLVIHQPSPLEVFNSGDYKVFTVVRNPYDRFISSLAYYANTPWAPAPGIPKPGAKRFGSFEDMFLSLQPGYGEKLDLELLKILRKNCPGPPAGVQGDHLTYHLFCEMNLHITGIRDVQILRYENLNEDISNYCSELGFKISIDAFKRQEIKNQFGYKKKRKSYPEYYTPETKEFVYEIFKDDFEIFGYSKDFK
jgi:hypothetical protein